MATAAVDCLALQISLLISLLLAIISHLFSSVSLDKLSAGSRATWEAQPAYKLHLILWRCIPSTPHSTQNKTFLFTLGTSNFCWENKCKEMKGFKYFVGMPRAQFEARKSLMFQAWKISLAIAALSQCSHSAHQILGDATQVKWILYPSKLLTQTPEQARVRAWGLSCRDKSVKEGGSIKILLVYPAEGSGNRVQGHQGVAGWDGAKAVLMPQSWWYPKKSFLLLSSPADTLSRAPEALNLFAAESLWHPGVKLLSKRRQGGWNKVKTTQEWPTCHFYPGKAANPKT